MTPEIAIKAENLSKIYQIYQQPIDRLKQMIFGKLRNKKFYNEYWALQGVDLEVYKGETVGIIGKNGSGKSTLLQIVCGTLRPTSGTLKTNGRIAALLELGAGFNPEFSGKENVYLAASILGLNDKQIKDRYDSICEFAGIGDFVDQPIKTYSSGMYARLAFAVAAHVDAEILIIDEILAVGDIPFIQKCMRYINKFKEHGTIFFVSHDINAVMNLCDKALWLENGLAKGFGETKDICNQYLASISVEAASGHKDAESFKIGGTRKALTKPPVESKDLRHELLKESNLKNVVQIFDFDPDAPWYGCGGASILDVSLLDEKGEKIKIFDGGELVVLQITCLANKDLKNPIVGFYVKDRLGQNLFGDNTYLSFSNKNISINTAEEFEASFKFNLPYLPLGDYSIDVAIAEGSQENHIHHVWSSDILSFHVTNSHTHQGLIGIPMLGISLEQIN